MARLSTHVLDLARGVPAAGVAIDLHAVEDGARRHITRAVTNADGRTEQPLLTGERLQTGVYELTFHAGEYLQATGVTMTSPPFLGEIVVRVGIADPSGNYHIPLLLSPFGYSTYRGS
jgi:5-hydroxyisourate hydrolase